MRINSRLSAEKKLTINLLMSTNQITSLMTESLKPFGISIPQFNVLRILRGQKGNPANLSTIHDKMINQMSNTSRLIDKLLEKELVERSLCEENRRKVEIFITPAGLAILNKVDPVVEATEQKIARSLSLKEIEKLNELLEKLKD